MSERETIVQVESFTDISDRLPSREAEAVARSLNASSASVLVTEDWIVEDKQIEAIDGEQRVFVGECERETKKAWLFATGETQDWVPKSQSVLFSAATTATIKTPQQQLGEFEQKTEAEL